MRSLFVSTGFQGTGLIRTVWRPAVAVLLVAFSAPLFVGCQPKPLADEPPADAAPAEDDTSSMDARIEEALAKLSPEDRAAAEQQKICPVSGEPLGSMGTPMKVTAGEREVFICCEGCKDSLQAEPEKYLSKLDAAPAS